MTTSVSRRLNILIIAFFIKTLFTQLYVRVGILLTRGKYLHVRIISIKWNFCDHKTSLTPPLFIEVLVAIQESEWSCLWMLEVSILLLSMVALLDLRNVPTVWYFRDVPTVWWYF